MPVSIRNGIYVKNVKFHFVKDHADVDDDVEFGNSSNYVRMNRFIHPVTVRE